MEKFMTLEEWRLKKEHYYLRDPHINWAESTHKEKGSPEQRESAYQKWRKACYEPTLRAQEKLNAISIPGLDFELMVEDDSIFVIIRTQKGTVIISGEMGAYSDLGVSIAIDGELIGLSFLAD